jgi:hypothetical protein
MTLFSPVGSLNHANHTALQENDLEKKVTDTSGRKCLDAFERLSRATSWAKTFSELLIGTGDWYSTRCKLTWKLKGTKYKRLYFQLAPSTRPIGETEFGLLRTPAAQEPGINAKNLTDKDGNPAQIGSRAYTKTGRLAQVGITQQVQMMGLLPTPIVSNVHHAERVKKLKESGAETMASRKLGANRPNGLIDYLDFNGMLPTPQARDEKNGSKLEDGRIQRKIEQGWSMGLNDLSTMGMLPTPGHRNIGTAS